MNPSAESLVQRRIRARELANPVSGAARIVGLVVGSAVAIGFAISCLWLWAVILVKHGQNPFELLPFYSYVIGIPVALYWVLELFRGNLRARVIVSKLRIGFAFGAGLSAATVVALIFILGV